MGIIEQSTGRMLVRIRRIKYHLPSIRPKILREIKTIPAIRPRLVDMKHRIMKKIGVSFGEIRILIAMLSNRTKNEKTHEIT